MENLKELARYQRRVDSLSGGWSNQIDAITDINSDLLKSSLLSAPVEKIWARGGSSSTLTQSLVDNYQAFRSIEWEWAKENGIDHDQDRDMHGKRHGERDQRHRGEDSRVRRSHHD